MITKCDAAPGAVLGPVLVQSREEVSDVWELKPKSAFFTAQADLGLRQSVPGPTRAVPSLHRVPPCFFKKTIFGLTAISRLFLCWKLKFTILKTIFTARKNGKNAKSRTCCGDPN